MTGKTYFPNGLREFCNRQLQYGQTRDGTGYLRILSFGDFAGHGDDIRALDSALDVVLSQSGLRALIVDVRLAFGGDDRLGLAIASRLTDSEYLAYSIQARADPVAGNRWTEPAPVAVRPGRRPRFTGPIVELIGPVTMSAAETFTQALMGRVPKVMRIGEETQGVFCDPLERHLPNGWTFALPNAIYRTADGLSFDVRGIPPHIRVAVYADSDIAEGRDAPMAAALQAIGVRAIE